MLDKFEKFNHQLSNWFQWIGVAGMLLIMAISGIDVIGAKLFHSPLAGTIDIVMLSQIVAIAFPASMVLILGRHIRVELLITRLSRRAQAVISSVALLLGFGLFVLIIWQLCVLGYSFQTSGEQSQTARISYYPFAYGIALACIPVCLVHLQKILSCLVRVVKG